MEIKYNPGNIFRVTVTASGELRIKLPQNVTVEDKAIWISRAVGIHNFMLENPYTATLRAHATKVGKALSLHTAGKISRCIYTVPTNTSLPIPKEK